MSTSVNLDLDLAITPEGTINLSSLEAPFVLFFYPKDNTPGCTTEAIGFSEALDQFAAQGIKVFGVSKDPMKSHDKFVSKHALTMPLISDETTDLCERFGVWKEKSMYGKTYMGIKRSTFFVRPDGEILHEWRKVKVPGHVEAVLEAVTA